MSFKKPAEIAQQFVEVGTKKITLSFGKVLVLAILAGVFISFGAELSTVVSHDLKGFSLGFARFMAGSVFAVGLILVVIAGAELFTGNCLMIIPLLERKIKFNDLLKFWFVVYVGNFIGAILLSFLIFYSGIYGTSTIATYAVEIAANKVNLDFTQALLRGIGANILVVLAVWLAVASDDIIGKIAGIFFPIMAFVASGLEHSIANMFFIPIGILLKNSVLTSVPLDNLNITGFLLNNLLPVTIGNIIGGAVFIGAVYWYVYFYKTKK